MRLLHPKFTSPHPALEPPQRLPRLDPLAVRVTPASVLPRGRLSDAWGCCPWHRSGVWRPLPVPLGAQQWPESLPSVGPAPDGPFLQGSRVGTRRDPSTQRVSRQGPTPLFRSRVEPPPRGWGTQESREPQSVWGGVTGLVMQAPIPGPGSGDPVLTTGVAPEDAGPASWVWAQTAPSAVPALTEVRVHTHVSRCLDVGRLALCSAKKQSVSTLDPSLSPFRPVLEEEWCVPTPGEAICFPGCSAKEPACQRRRRKRRGPITGPVGSHGAGHGSPLQDLSWRIPGTEEPMGYGPWATERRTRLSGFAHTGRWKWSSAVGWVSFSSVVGFVKLPLHLV